MVIEITVELIPNGEALQLQRLLGGGEVKAIALHALLGWRKVTARRNIQDSPLAVVDCSARRGDKGEVVDYDDSAGLLFVDFGRGAIACSPKDVR